MSKSLTGPGYDHIARGIGAAMIGGHDCSLLRCITPKKHLSLTTREFTDRGAEVRLNA